MFTTTNLSLLHQATERVAIVVDDTLAYQEIHRLRGWLVNENLALTGQFNNAGSEFSEIIGHDEVIYSTLK